MVSRPFVMIDASRDRGLRFIRPGASLSMPSATPSGALTRKLMYRICEGENGCPAAMLRMLAPRNVMMYATSSMITKRMNLLRLS